MYRIRSGDVVEVIAGNDRGVRGEVIRVYPTDHRITVKGVHIVKKHQRRMGGVQTQTGIIEFEAPIAISNVAPVCASCDRWTRVGFQTLNDGRKVRICRRCGGTLD